MKIYTKSRQNGFTLIECSIALVITMIGVLGAAALIGVAIRLQVESRQATTANAFARAKVEELENASPSSSVRAEGGGLTTNVTGYNDVVDTRYRRRWLIENSASGIPTKTQRITVVVVSEVPGTPLPAVRLTALLVMGGP